MHVRLVFVSPNRRDTWEIMIHFRIEETLAIIMENGKWKLWKMENGSENKNSDSQKKNLCFSLSTLQIPPKSQWAFQYPSLGHGKRVVSRNSCATSAKCDSCGNILSNWCKVRPSFLGIFCCLFYQLYQALLPFSPIPIRPDTKDSPRDGNRRKTFGNSPLSQPPNR